MDRPVRFGYVGCGFMAQGVHLPNFAAIPGVELVALAELRPELGAKVQRRWGFRKLYRSHLDLAKDPEVEAVGVSAAFGEQPAIAQDLLRAGRQVFMEKPMATSVAQAEAMLEAGRTGGGRLMVAYMKRYDGGNEIAKRHLDQFRGSGELGPAFYARNHGFCGNWTAGFDVVLETSDEPRPAPAPARHPDWLPEPLQQRYLGYLQQYTHNINLLRWFLDAGDQARVTAVDLDQDGYTGLATFDMEGVRAVVESGSISHHTWDEHTQIYFRDGWVRVASPPLLMKNASAKVEIYRGARGQEARRRQGSGGQASSCPTREHPVAIPYSWAFRREAEHFISCVRSGDPFRSSGEDTLTDVRLFEGIYRMHMASEER